VYDARALIRMAQLRREAEAEAERQHNDPYGTGVPVSREVQRARGEQFARRMREVTERRQTPSQLALPGIKPTLMALRYPALMTRRQALANGLVLPPEPAAAVDDGSSVQLELPLAGPTREPGRPRAARPIKREPALVRPRPSRSSGAILDAIRAVASQPVVDEAPLTPEPVRFRASKEELRLAGQMFAPAGGDGRPPAGPPPGIPATPAAPLPSGRPRTGVTMAGSRLPGILGLGLASLGGIAGAMMQDDNALTSEVTTSLGLGLGGAGFLAAATLRSPAEAKAPWRRGR
jgi:hypothetical protein